MHKRIEGVTFALLGLSFAACGGTGATGAGGTGGSTSVTNGSTSQTVTSTAAKTSATVTGSTSGGPTFVCDPPAPTGSLYEKSATELTKIDPTSMCEFRGDVLLIVDTAGVCGYTPQMAPLQILEDTFSSQNFHVLGFFENSFNQAGDPETCTTMFGATFPVFEIADVKAPNAQPVWQWILAQTNPGPAPSIAPSWNFNKYLISRDGQLIAHWAEQVYPGDDPSITTDSFDTNEIVVAIKAELAK